MSNTKTLNEHLFDTLDRLSSAAEDDIDLEVRKAASIISVSQQILSVSRLKLEILQGAEGIKDQFEEIDKPLVNGSDKKKLIR